MPFATESDAAREYAHNAGADRPEAAWILSPYDSWERNPFYRGPAQPHPEEAADMLCDADFEEAAAACRAGSQPATEAERAAAVPLDDLIPW